MWCFRTVTCRVSAPYPWNLDWYWGGKRWHIKFKAYTWWFWTVTCIWVHVMVLNRHMHLCTCDGSEPSHAFVYMWWFWTVTCICVHVMVLNCHMHLGACDGSELSHAFGRMWWFWTVTCIWAHVMVLNCHMHINMTTQHVTVLNCHMYISLNTVRAISVDSKWLHMTYTIFPTAVGVGPGNNDNHEFWMCKAQDTTSSSHKWIISFISTYTRCHKSQNHLDYLWWHIWRLKGTRNRFLNGPFLHQLSKFIFFQYFDYILRTGPPKFKIFRSV